MNGKWRPGPKSLLCQAPVDGGLCEGGLEPAHGPAAKRAGGQIGAKHMGQEPGPAVARWGRGVVLIGVVVAAVADGGKAELVTGRGGWPSLGRLGRQRRHDLSPQSGVAREDAKIPALERAATSLAALLEKWNSREASALLAPTVDPPKLEREFAKLSLIHGACKVQRALESDGKSRATFALSCKERPLELSLALDASGRVARASGRPPRSETTPNCAE